MLAARLGAELAKRAGLPAVVGELAAGIVVGPSFFGHYFPDAFAAVFPRDQAQFYLLDVVGTLGMVLLLLLTGLETDLRLLRNLGRAAFIASGMGMVVPFAFGLGRRLAGHRARGRLPGKAGRLHHRQRVGRAALRYAEGTGGNLTIALMVERSRRGGAGTRLAHLPRHRSAPQGSQAGLRPDLERDQRRGVERAI